MISNKFIHEIDFEFDPKQIDLTNLRQNNNLLSHQRLVSDYPYMIELAKRFKFLSDRFNIYNLSGNSSWRIHIDAKRNAALNIPIQNADHARTDFYETVDRNSLTLIPEKAFYILNQQPQKIYSFYLKRPTIINTSIPHNVTNLSNDIRIILSWSIKQEYSYEECVQG